MDWFLAATTLLVNANLGWSKGAWWAWIVHAMNAAMWIVYAVDIEQMGLVLLSVITIAVDVLSARRALRRLRHEE